MWFVLCVDLPAVQERYEDRNCCTTLVETVSGHQGERFMGITLLTSSYQSYKRAAQH